MTKSLSSLAAGVIVFAIASSPALAANRTFVSGVGTDTGTCPITTPCRTFAYALTQTSPSGEIVVLSSAGYGAVTINKAVSIINTSNYAAITVASGNGITINAGAGDSVVLRGISLDGSGSIASNGIVFSSGGNLTIDQCNMQNFAANTGGVGYGILLQPAAGNHTIIISNTTSSNNVEAGVAYQPPAGTATSGIVIDHVSANNNGTGIEIDGPGSGGAVSASISNTIASGNGIGYNFESMGNASLDLSYASGNSQYGIYLGNATVALGRSVLMNNAVGLNLAAGGIVNSYKDNRIAGNGTNVSGTISTATLF
jgi:hypothetical protein